METYFSRHTQKLDIDQPTRDRLWQERRIAIHFPWLNNDRPQAQDSRSLNENDYKDIGSKRAIRALNRLCREGGYVCSYHYPQNKSLIGKVSKNSKIEILKGKWGSLQKKDGRTAILKTIRLEKATAVDPLDHALLLVGCPRQGTLMRWHLAGMTIANLVEGKKTNPELRSLSAAQQEIMCAEFLRTSAASRENLPLLKHLLLPPGRTMKDIDILGLDGKGRRIIAQVTYSKKESVNYRAKIDRLSHLVNDGEQAILFCNCEHPDKENGITIFPLSRVFSAWEKTGLGKRWLQLSC